MPRVQLEAEETAPWQDAFGEKTSIDEATARPLPIFLGSSQRFQFRRGRLKPSARHCVKEGVSHHLLERANSV